MEMVKLIRLRTLEEFRIRCREDVTSQAANTYLDSLALNFAQFKLTQGLQRTGQSLATRIVLMVAGGDKWELV